MTTTSAVEERLSAPSEFQPAVAAPVLDARETSSRRSSLFRVLVGTALTSALTLGITAFYTGVLASRLDPSQFGAYLLAMRVASLLLPFATVAIGTALARQIAMSRSSEETNGYLLAGTLLGMVPALLLAAIGAANPYAIAAAVFGGTAGPGPLFGALTVLVGYAGFTVFFAYYRGLEKMAVANVGQLLLMGIGPALVVLSIGGSGDVRQVLMGVGVVAGFGMIGVLGAFLRALTDSAARRRLLGSIKELFRYGAGRAPGGAALQAMLLVGPFFANRSMGLADAGYLLTALTLLRLAEVATSDFGTVMLPRVAAMEAEGQKQRLREGLTDLLAFIGFLGPYVSLHAIVWARPLLLVWVGPKYEAAIPVARMMLLALVPYVTFMMLRSVLDALEIKPLNAIHLAITLGATAMLSALSTALGWGLLGLAGATVIGFWILAALSVRALWVRLPFGGKSMGLAQAAAVNAVLLLPAAGVATALPGNWSPLQTLVCGGVLEVILLAACMFAAWKLRARWATELARRLRFSLA